MLSAGLEKHKAIPVLV